jgi:hypothetical protein
LASEKLRDVATIHHCEIFPGGEERELPHLLICKKLSKKIQANFEGITDACKTIFNRHKFSHGIQQDAYGVILKIVDFDSGTHSVFCAVKQAEQISCLLQGM